MDITCHRQFTVTTCQSYAFQHSINFYGQLYTSRKCNGFFTEHLIYSKQETGRSKVYELVLNYRNTGFYVKALERFLCMLGWIIWKCQYLTNLELKR